MQQDVLLVTIDMLLVIILTGNYRFVLITVDVLLVIIDVLFEISVCITGCEK
jgi:hypothetical protein